MVPQQDNTAILRRGQPAAMIFGLVAALLDVKSKLGLCRLCNNISDSELCLFCADPHRDRSVLCVVEEPHNIVPVETTRQFSGLYHVLHGAISPLRGIGPDQLHLGGPGTRETTPNVEPHQTSVQSMVRLAAQGC